MDKMKNYISKNEIVQLLDRGSELDEAVFSKVDGEKFSSSKELIKIKDLESSVQTLIPNNIWEKSDYIIKYEDIELSGTMLDKKGKRVLLVSIKNMNETFMVTNEAVSQLFSLIDMSSYAKFILDQQLADEEYKHFELLKQNYNYWFKGELAAKDVMIRTVKENGDFIIRCFASPSYQKIDNNVLLYCTVWTLDKLKYNFRLSSQSIDHSYMKLNFLSDDVLIIPDLGTLSYGFTIINSEAKTHTVEILPTCIIENTNGVKLPIILDKIIKIKHYGKDIDRVMEKIQNLSKLPEHVAHVMETINILKKKKVNDLLLYKIRLSLINVIGNTAFRKNKDAYDKVLSSNTLNLIQLLANVNKIELSNEDKRIELESMFWSMMNQE